MKTITIRIECKDSIPDGKVISRAAELFNPADGFKGVEVCNQSVADFQREKRLNEYFEQVEYNLNCLKDKLYKIKRDIQ